MASPSPPPPWAAFSCAVLPHRQDFVVFRKNISYNGLSPTQGQKGDGADALRSGNEIPGELACVGLRPWGLCANWVLAWANSVSLSRSGKKGKFFLAFFGRAWYSLNYKRGEYVVREFEDNERKKWNDDQRYF